MLLLDEPFGALDAKVRSELRAWLRRFHDEFHVTSIFVTHDQEEAFEVADRVVVMNKGRIEQAGTPIEVFEHPANAFVMDFLGNVNKLPVRVEGGEALLGRNGHGRGAGEAVRHRPRTAASTLTSARTNLTSPRRPTAATAFRPSVVHVNPAGSVVKVRLMAEDFGLMINVDLTPERYRAPRLHVSDSVYRDPQGREDLRAGLHDLTHLIGSVRPTHPATEPVSFAQQKHHKLKSPSHLPHW